MFSRQILGVSSFAALLLLLPPSPFSNEARAQSCDMANYSHNGSLMTVHACDDGRLTIEYSEPKGSLARHGVRPGTLLMQGRAWDSGGPFRRVNGTAYLFKKGCRPSAYKVEGYWMDSGRLELSGVAPVRKNGCRVTGKRQDSLVFNGR